MHLHIISRDQAKSIGLKTYFTGNVCGKGHVSLRRVSNHRCIACATSDESKAAAKVYRDATKDKKSEYGRRYYAENQERERARSAAYRRENMDVYRKWFDSNKELIREKSRQRRANNPEKHKEYYRKNADRFRAYYEEYNITNKDRIAKIKALYNSKNNEKARAWRRNTKAKRKAAEGRHSQEDVVFLINSQKHKCANCKTCLKKSGYHVDHVHPLALGGTNWPDNLQLLCPSCNLSKGAKDPIEWAQVNGRLL